MSSYDPRQFVTWEERAVTLIERLPRDLETLTVRAELRRLIEVTPEDCRMRMVRLPESEWGRAARVEPDRYEREAMGVHEPPELGFPK